MIALLAPLLVALLLAVIPPLRRRFAPALCIAGSVVSFGAAILQPPGTTTVPWLKFQGAVIAEVGVRVDAISGAMLLVVTLVALMVQLFSLGYMKGETPAALGRYFAYHALFLFSMNLLVVAPNLLQLFIGWELVGVTSYLLIGFYYKKPSAARAAVKAFWITKLADMGFLVGLAVLYVSTGGFAWDVATPAATAITLLFFFAVMGKSAQFPLHVWLPDAMEGPTPVSALLHAATMVAAGVFLIVRANPLFAQAEITGTVMLVVGSGTAFFAATVALVQRDIKKVLAYSTCSQLGYMIAALGAGSLLGGFFHLTTHAFFKALLFLGAGSAIHAVGSNDIRAMGGLARKMRLTTVAFIVGALALSGIPGLSGFFSKELVLGAVEGKLGNVPYGVLVTTGFLTALYMGRVVLIAFFGAPSEAASRAHEGGIAMRAPLVVLGALAAGAGWFARPFGARLGIDAHLHVGVVPIAAAVLGLIVAYATRAKEPTIKLPSIDRLYELLFRRVALVLADRLAWIDRYVVDGMINLLGYAGLEGARRGRRIQTGHAPDYVLAAVVGVVCLAIWGVSR